MRVKCNSEGINTAANSIKEGGVVIFPTDTVYGIGCDPYNKIAVERIYSIKNREAKKFFPVLGFSKDQLQNIVTFDEKSYKIAEKFWPGQVTIILPLKDEDLKKSMGLVDKIAVRVPNNDCVLKLLEQCNFVIGTSANISGTNSFADPDECENAVSDFDVFLDGGKISSAGESTVIEISGDEIQILRSGSVSKEEILNLF